MFTANRTFNVIDTAFSGLETLSEFDYVAFGDKVINATATVCAVTVAVVSYIVTALQLFWLEHGQVITVSAIRFVINAVDFAGDCYHTGRKLRPVVIHNLNRLADTVFYTLAA